MFCIKHLTDLKPLAIKSFEYFDFNEYEVCIYYFIQTHYLYFTNLFYHAIFLWKVKKPYLIIYLYNFKIPFKHLIF